MCLCLSALAQAVGNSCFSKVRVAQHTASWVELLVQEVCISFYNHKNSCQNSVCPRLGWPRFFQCQATLTHVIADVYNRCCIKTGFNHPLSLDSFVYTSVCPTSSPSSSSISLHLCLLDGLPGRVVECETLSNFILPCMGHDDMYPPCMGHDVIYLPMHGP